jgi:two-component system, chemotaxis family, chemotaxis protein CheY
MRVLVVDDQATMRRIIVKIVEKVGVDECREAADGQDALRILAVTDIDLIITDWNMPGMSGLDFIRTLRAQEATRAIPVIMVTSNSSKDEVMDAIKLGVTAYVVKPFTAEAMTERIRTLLFNS